MPDHPSPDTPCGPLAGLRVVDFTRVLSGPFCTALLADLGAEVWKIEPPQGDDYRAIGPMRDGHSALFNVVNRNKRSIVLDLKQPAAVELALSLCDEADVVIENFRPGVAQRLGIGHEVVRQRNPRAVYASISGFGQTGAAADRPAYDIVIQAVSGLMEVTGSPDGPPTLVGEAVSDVVSGLFASWGVLAALLGRERTGEGTHIDISMLDATLAFTATSVARYLFTGRDPQRVGNRHPLSTPFGVYAAADGHYVLAVLNQRLFQRLCATIGQPALAAEPRYASDELRSQHEPELREAIEAWSRQRSVRDTVAALEAAEVPAAPIGSIGQILRDEAVRERGWLQAVDDPELPGLELPSQPLQFSAHPRRPVVRAPRLGEHTRQALADVLGLAGQRIEELRAAGAFGPASAATAHAPTPARKEPA